MRDTHPPGPALHPDLVRISTRVPAYSYWIAAGLFVSAALLWTLLTQDRARVRTAFGFLILWAAAAIFSIGGAHWGIPLKVVDEVARTLLILAAVQIGFLVIFDLALQKVRLPKFASEIAIVAAYAAAVIELLTRLGINATSLFATSAVATAVVGLALQDMLSNLAGGMTLQLEDSINVGDYIHCGEYSGWVEHVRLRHTSLLTSDGDTVVVPNSYLTRSAFLIVSKAHRHFIPFAMPYSYDPHEVIDAIQTALRGSPLEGVAADPKPNCLIQDMTPGHILYRAVVWFTKPGQDSVALSAVLNRIYYALDRAGIGISEITYLLENKAPTSTFEESKPEEILRRIPIFRLLEDKDLVHLAVSLRRHTYAPGELIFRQGDSGDSMYFVVAGHIGVTLRAPDGVEKEIATFNSGDFFGEVSLLTGERRSVTATATSRVVCYCLEKGGLQRTMELHPDLAEDMSVIMVHRQVELTAAREMVDRDTMLRRSGENQTQMLARIRRFFGIANTSARA